MDTTPPAAAPRVPAQTGRAAPRALPRFGPRTRAVLRSAHAVAGAGWAGAHATLLTLAAIALAGPAAERDTALAGAGLAAGALVLPLSLATLATGLALSLGTHWGLVRHWWVAVKLVLTAALVTGSNLSIGPAIRAAGADPAAADAAIRISGTGALAVSFTVLLTALVLSTVKPWGRTPWARRPRRSPRPAARS